MLELFKLDNNLSFPSVDLALTEPNGLLAFGGDLSVERLVYAYNQGIFPWYSEGEPLLWWSPDPRGIVHTDDYRPARSLKKSVRKYQYTASMDQDFESVIRACAHIPRNSALALDDDFVQDDIHTDTWITPEMLEAYTALHKAGFAHSVEVWDKNQELVGGLYGIAINGCFCGESMFHLQNDASKAAFWALTSHMRKFGLTFIDCQMVNPHLASLGCIEVPRTDFINMLKDAAKHTVSEACWKPQALEFSI